MVRVIMGDEDEIGFRAFLQAIGVDVYHHSFPIDSEAVMAEPVDVGCKAYPYSDPPSPWLWLSKRRGTG